MITIIRQNEKALLVLNGTNYETWLNMTWSFGKRKGELIIPKDEDFGVKAWSHYNLEGALAVFDEITSGKRGIRPMLEAVEF